MDFEPVYRQILFTEDARNFVQQEKNDYVLERTFMKVFATENQQKLAYFIEQIEENASNEQIKERWSSQFFNKFFK